MTQGPKYGYYPKPSKSFLIVKQHYKEYGEIIFVGSNINITTENQSNLLPKFLFSELEACFVNLFPKN